MNFIVDPEVKQLGVEIIGLVVENIDNQYLSQDYLDYRKRAIEDLYIRCSHLDIKQDPIIEGFYALHDKVHVKRRKNPPAPETLIRYLQKKGTLPSVNKLVDLYNIESIQSKLALGAHDIDTIVGNVTLRLTNGEETFIPLGYTENKPVNKGEYSYIDDSNDILCHLEIRQVEKTKVTENSKNVFFIVQGNQATTKEYVKETALHLLETITRFCGGQGYIIEN